MAPATGASRSESAANASSASVSTPRARSTTTSSLQRAAKASSSVVLPIPGSPCTTRARPWPARKLPSNSSSLPSSAARLTIIAPNHTIALMSESMRRVAVVGAGPAGLAAATGLVRGGHDVVVLEARDRVGGRVWSQRLRNGAVVEMGAEFILPGNTVVEDTVRRLGLGLWEKGMAYGRREPRGGE